MSADLELATGRHVELLSVARLRLQEAETIPDITQIVDYAEAVRVTARKVGLSLDAQNDWAEYKLDSERKGGQLLARMELKAGRPNGDTMSPLAELGLHKHQSSRWQRIASLPHNIYDAFKDETRAAGKEITSAEATRLAKRLDRETDQKRRAEEAAAVMPKRAEIVCASWDEWLPAQPTCDLLLTDPPYSSDIDEDIDTFANRWLPVALNKVKPTGRAYICIGAYWDELGAYLNVPVPDHLVHANAPLIWTYRNTIGPSPTYDYKLNAQAILYYWGKDAPPLDCPLLVEQFSVQDINAPEGHLGRRWHPWQKPDLLGERFVRHATQPGHLVLDPFAGTGTFLLAAARLGRVARGCDISDEQVQIALERGCERAERLS